jgi:serine/threonine protein kinase
MSFRPAPDTSGLSSDRPSSYPCDDDARDVHSLPTRVDLPAMSTSRPPPAPATWAPGAVVPGTVYRVIRPLGSGGMGDVYEAEHELLGVRRALKVLSRKMASREDLAERLRVEARALAGLRHPNLVGVHDLGLSSDGRVFFAMELLEGATLRDLLRRAGRLKPDQAVAIAVQVLDALGAAHDQGMVHRDVKPENVFVQRTGTVKLLDFGVAKAMQGSSSAAPLTAAGMAVGTPRYMAPEQAEGHPVDARCDLYGVGILLWEMLAGRPPNHHLDAVAAAVAAVTRGVPSLADAGIDAPASLIEVVTRATARDREHRFPTASALSAELRMAKARSWGTPAPTGVETITVRYEESATSLVPLVEASDDGATTEMGALGRTSHTSVATSELTRVDVDASADATELRMSLPFDPREMATPTSVPLASSPSRPPPSLPPPAPRASAFPLSFWIGVPAAMALTVIAMLWIGRPDPMPHDASAALADPPSAQLSTPILAASTGSLASAASAASASAAAASAAPADAAPSAVPAAPASSSGNAPGAQGSSAAAKPRPPARHSSGPARPTSKPKTGWVLPGSGL